MEQLKQDIQELVARAGEGAGFGELMQRFVEALQRQPQALGELQGRYRLETTDTGLCCAFALSEDGYQPLEKDEKVDAAISGKEADLLALIRREMNPMTAMFTGKVRVQGSMQALAKFAQVL